MSSSCTTRGSIHATSRLLSPLRPLTPRCRSGAGHRDVSGVIRPRRSERTTPAAGARAGSRPPTTARPRSVVGGPVTSPFMRGGPSENLGINRSSTCTPGRSRSPRRREERPAFVLHWRGPGTGSQPWGRTELFCSRHGRADSFCPRAFISRYALDLRCPRSTAPAPSGYPSQVLARDHWTGRHTADSRAVGNHSSPWDFSPP